MTKQGCNEEIVRNLAEVEVLQASAQKLLNSCPGCGIINHLEYPLFGEWRDSTVIKQWSCTCEQSLFHPSHNI